MSWLNKIGRFFVYSNLYVSIATAGLVKVSELLLGIEGWTVAGFLFFSTLFAYNFQRLYKQVGHIREKSTYHLWIHNNRVSLIVLTSIAGLCSFLLALQLSIYVWLCLIPLGIISLMYPVHLFTRNGKKYRLRDIPGLKLFLIALVWAFATVFISVLNNHIPIDETVYVLLIQRFLFVIAITIPFDIRDVDFDKEMLHTLPQTLGVKKARNIALVAILLFGITTVVQYAYADIHMYQFLALLLTTIITGILIYKSTPDRPSYFYTIFMEGTSILMLLLVVLAEFFQ